MRRSWQDDDIVKSGATQLLQLPDSLGQTGLHWDTFTTASACMTEHTSPCPTRHSNERLHGLIIRAPRLTARYTTICTTTTAVPPVRSTSRSISRSASETQTKSASKPSRTLSRPTPTQAGLAVFQALYVSTSTIDHRVNGIKAEIVVFGFPRSDQWGFASIKRTQLVSVPVQLCEFSALNLI